MKEKDFLLKIIQQSFASPSAIAVSHQKNQLTYRELIQSALKVANYLKSNVEPPSSSVLDLIAINGDQGVYAYPMILGIWFSGYTYFSFNESWPERQKTQIRSDLPICFELHHDFVAEHISKWDMPFENELNSPQDVYTRIASAYESSSCKYAYLICTSGSTGKGKYIPISFGNLSAFMDHYNDRSLYNINSKDRVLQTYDLSFDVSVFSYLLALTNGACLVIPQATGMKFLGILHELLNNEITVLSSVPSFLMSIKSKLSTMEFPNLRYSFFSGESLFGEEARLWMNACPNAAVYNCYGPTETTIVFTSENLNSLDNQYFTNNRPLPIGDAFQGVDISLEEGELWAEGPQVFDGYYEQEEITFRSSPFNTKDLIERDSNGKFLFRGRSDFQVQLKGHRVEPQAVDVAVAKLGLGKSYTLGLQDQENKMLLVTLIQNVKNGSELFADVLSALKSELPAYHLPEKIISVTEFPLNHNGKVDHQSLLQLAKKVLKV